MDWLLVLNIALWVFAPIGLLAVIILIWALIDDRNYKPSNNYGMPMPMMNPTNERTFAEQLTRKQDYVGNPTLRGEVDMIKKHLGIEVVVKPAKPAELAVIKKKR